MDANSLSNIQSSVSPFHFRIIRSLINFFAIILILILTDFSIGQENQGIGIRQIETQNNRPSFTGAHAFINADSIVEDFGIGYATFMLGEGDEAIERIGAARLIDNDNRIFYSFVEAPSMRKLKTYLQIPLENRIRVHKIWFLFKSPNLDSPLSLSMRGSGESGELKIVIEKCEKRKFEKHVKKWRKQFTEAMAAQRAVSDYPPILEDYLESMLLGRVTTEKIREGDEKKKNKVQVKSLGKTVGLLLDLESTRGDFIAELMNPGQNDIDKEDERVALPDSIRFSEKVPSRELPQSVVVEEIAKAVPASCFYLRFGNWSNQIWLKKLMDEYGGDLSRMLTVRGYKKLVQSKFLEQLCVQAGPLDEWFGGTKVKDVALIGSDFYFRSGAGVGIVLQAQPNQTESLKRNFEKKRNAIVEAAKNRIFQRISKKSGVSFDDVDSVRQGVVQDSEFSGHEVNFIETRVQRADVQRSDVLKATLGELVYLRSYYVVKGDFHLITSSREMVKQFLEIQDGRGASLGNSDDFRAFRSRDPFQSGSVNRILFFASNSFLKNLFSPSFQVELARRNRLQARIQVLEMATLAARNEGVALSENDDIFGELKDGKFLPENFSHQGLERNGSHWIDQKRGRFGFFKPLADVGTENCAPWERDEYLEKKKAVKESIKDLEPVYFHLDRQKASGAGDVEVISFDSRITAIGEDDLDWALGRLGPKMKTEVAWLPENEERPIVELNLSLKKKQIFKRNFDYRLFLVVDDGAIPNVDLKPTSILQPLKTREEIPGFVATNPAAGVLNWFFPSQRPALFTNSNLNREIRESKVLNLYRLEDTNVENENLGDEVSPELKGFNAVSFDENRLMDLELKNVRVVDGERTQVHLKINGLNSESELNRWVNSINYRRSWQTSIANVKFMNFVSRQLGTDAKSVKETCEYLLGVVLHCSLDGKYEVVDTGGGVEVNFSNAWPDFVAPVRPKDYQAPVLGWFRGCELRLSKEADGGRFELTGTLKVKREPKTGLELPLFKGFKGLFGGGEK